MLIDEAHISIIGGKGGDGAVTFFPGYTSGPSGGDGGKGGNVYARVNRNVNSLYKYSTQTKFEALSGGKGANFNKTGADGKDLVLDFPLGTELIELKTGRIIALPENGQPILICQGGRGGFGNDKFKSPTNRAPRKAEKGFPGEKRTFDIIMRLIADIGLIGLPNAGKSSLLNELTKAQARIAPYPFTTLEPNLGALDKAIIADIPGLIEGASSGKGLGIKFLKHIEKVKLLLHCVSLDTPLTQMKKDYKTVRTELATFNTDLTGKKEIVLLTKSDLILPRERKSKQTAFKKINKDSYCISVHDLDALEDLKKLLQEQIH